MKIEAVIFDCDGTLVDSETLSNQVLVDFVAEFGLTLSLEDAMSRFVGGTLVDCVAEIERRLGRALPEDFIAQFRVRQTAAFRGRLRPIDGALSTVQRMRVPYCVASSGPREKIELSLGLTGLLPYFHDRIFSSYEVGTWKPEPGLFLHAAETLGVAPARCAVVEDSPPGIQAGLAAGMVVFAFQPLQSEGPTTAGVRVLRRLADLPDFTAGSEFE
ncbi:MAG TPA: HAD-IA family hydrolase [Blastocatellia bacterium]|nr:HAD-IA family hydrolase [Blastocatellia bacterium]